MINLKLIDDELERKLGHFLIDHKKEYPTQAKFIKQAIEEKLKRETPTK